jgi:hypothetical protein
MTSNTPVIFVMNVKKLAFMCGNDSCSPVHDSAEYSSWAEYGSFPFQLSINPLPSAKHGQIFYLTPSALVSLSFSPLRGRQTDSQKCHSLRKSESTSFILKCATPRKNPKKVQNNNSGAT